MKKIFLLVAFFSLFIYLVAFILEYAEGDLDKGLEIGENDIIIDESYDYIPNIMDKSSVQNISKQAVILNILQKNVSQIAISLYL